MGIGVTTAAIYGDWLVKSVLVVGALIIISGLLTILSVLLWRELRKRQDAEARLIEANADLERLSLTDALTGLGNRRSFDAALLAEARRSSRNRKPLGLIVIDVDQFKAYNDHYGHPEGDAALKIVADVLRNNARRPGDAAFRMGGEEFGVVLVDTPESGLTSVMEAIRRDLAALNVPHERSELGRLSVSLGATMIGKDGIVPATRRADAALCDAKRGGRDRGYIKRALTLVSTAG